MIVNQQPAVRMEKPSSFGPAIGCLLVLGLYLPTSSNGIASKVLFGVDYLLAFLLLALLVVNSADWPSPRRILPLLCIVPLLLLFTYTSGLPDRSWGEIVAFGVLSLLFATNLSNITVTPKLSRLYLWINFINIGLGVAIIVGNQVVDSFLISHYSSFYPDLVIDMLSLRKPVLTFGTHSLAGFFWYLLFYLSLQTYRRRDTKLYLCFALFYLFFMFAVLSVTGLLLGTVALIQLLYGPWSSLRNKWLWSTVAVALFVALAVCGILDPVFQVVAGIIDAANAILTLPVSGFSGRWGSDGNMYSCIHYLQLHPFSPIGAGQREGLVPGDMGLMDYLLRGSVILVVCVYLGLFRFLRRSLISRFDCWFLFCLIVTFEVGFSTLTYFRIFYLLPWFVVYLNGLRGQDRTTVVGSLSGAMG